MQISDYLNRMGQYTFRKNDAVLFMTRKGCKVNRVARLESMSNLFLSLGPMEMNTLHELFLSLQVSDKIPTEFSQYPEGSIVLHRESGNIFIANQNEWQVISSLNERR